MLDVWHEWCAFATRMDAVIAAARAAAPEHIDIGTPSKDLGECINSAAPRGLGGTTTYFARTSAGGTSGLAMDSAVGTVQEWRPSSPPRRSVPAPETRVESLEGVVEILDDDVAEVTLYEHGEPLRYAMPAEKLRRHGLRPGDTFYLDLIDNADGTTTSCLRPPKPEEQPPRDPAVRYKTVDELLAESDPW